MKHKSTPYVVQLLRDLRKIAYEIVILITFILLLIFDNKTMKEEYRTEVPTRNKSMYKWFKTLPDEN